ncbi:putative DNA (cytosine-5)-methyltransferase CMT1 isoform X1 [Capsella rubella]|uniref:putative DNA (cytosine-5)-methyltransferase CMT1 isoform X1 n=1 Tax=Capsella rubella TaxID=81985 RepID=UPI000CD5C4FC|nr:putative DNA (cytosine-5)-methyltransferase CMT1 isoform X1 [Capsella rubella]
MAPKSKTMKRGEPESDLCFVGKPMSVVESMIRWPLRYQAKKPKLDTPKTATNGPKKEIKQAKRHYEQALVDGVLINLNDDVYVTAESGKPNYIAKVAELFEADDGEPYFRAQWFYRPEDTVIKRFSELVQEKRVFLSNMEDDNPLTCIYSKVNIAKVPLPKIASRTADRIIPPCDFYYDMKYQLPHLTFASADDADSASSSTISSDSDSNCIVNPPKDEKFLLDLYSGCGAMSTGFCMGASLSGIKLTTKWAVDLNTSACASLKHNHPETEVRNEAAEDFLILLKEWKKLCEKFSLISMTEPMESISELEDEEGDEDEDIDETSIGTELSPGEFEVQEFSAIVYGDPNRKGEKSLHLRVRWKGYGPDDDTWEPSAGLENCKDKLKEFVTNGFKKNLLPLPGTAYSVCGGPPCQGVSGYNRFRNTKAPLEDKKNQQLLVFLDIIDFLKPKYVLMENVVDLLKFSEGYLARHAVASLVAMNYQTRLGMMTAGSYGVPQLRNRFFLWAAQPTEKLPPYPLPTHEVLKKFNTPVEFEDIQVGRAHKELLELEDALTLADAISDLPSVTNYEINDVRNYNEEGPKTDFQKYIALKRSETLLPLCGGDSSHMLFDHQPLELGDNDLERISYIPKKKGANFRDMPGVLVHKNKAKIDKSVKRAKLKSGKNVVPAYAISFVKGTSKKPFGRLWWDEIVNTVVTRAEPHNQCVIHPKQDRVLSVRENARLQGFPDCYKLCGTIKQKYIQVGNAVAVPVGVALGYAFGMASQGLTDDEPVMKLPFKYPECMQAKADDQSD